MDRLFVPLEVIRLRRHPQQRLEGPHRALVVTGVLRLLGRQVQQPDPLVLLAERQPGLAAGGQQQDPAGDLLVLGPQVECGPDGFEGLVRPLRGELHPCEVLERQHLGVRVLFLPGQLDGPPAVLQRRVEFPLLGLDDGEVDQRGRLAEPVARLPGQHRRALQQGDGLGGPALLGQHPAQQVEHP